jgi:hypothetical protein
MTPRCDYAGCSVIAVYPEDGWNFCWQHYCEHRADMYGEPWPTLKPLQFASLFAPAHGTSAAARAHQRRGETPCAACLDADRRRRNPDRRRGNWYRRQEAS